MNKNPEIKEMTLNGDTFADMKSDFDAILAKTLSNMERKSASEAVITLKMNICLGKHKKNPGNINSEEVVTPSFSHEIRSVMQVKDKVTGALTGDYELKYDEVRQKYTMVPITDPQVSLYDIIDDIHHISNQSPFDYLKGFIGRKLVTSCREDCCQIIDKETGEVVVSSQYDETEPRYCDPNKIIRHQGHEIICVGYGDTIIVNVSIECDDCCEVIYSLDADDDAEINIYN